MDDKRKEEKAKVKKYLNGQQNIGITDSLSGRRVLCSSLIKRRSREDETKKRASCASRGDRITRGEEREKEEGRGRDKDNRPTSSSKLPTLPMGVLFLSLSMNSSFSSNS
jgi:hypothetical protein